MPRSLAHLLRHLGKTSVHLMVLLSVWSIAPLQAQIEFSSFAPSQHLASNIQISGTLSADERSVRIWRHTDTRREQAVLVAPAFALTAPNNRYFRWTDPSAEPGVDYQYWAEALDAGGKVFEQIGPVVGRRPLDMVDLSRWNQVQPESGSDFGNHPLRLLNHGGYLYLYGSGTTLRRSADGGTTWVAISTGSTAFTQLVGGDQGVLLGRFLTSGDYGELWRSTDQGTTWTRLPTKSSAQGEQGLSSQIDSLAFGLGRWIAKSGQTIFRSTDNGATWTNLGQKFSTNQLDAILFVKDRFVVRPYNSDIISHSADGDSWSGVDVDTTKTGGTFRWIIHTGTEYVACPPIDPNSGYKQRIYRSSNFSTWTATDITPAQRRLFSDIAPQVISGRLYGVRGTQLIRTANLSNLSDWEVVDDNTYLSIVHTGTRFLASGPGGFLASSTDGLNWTGIGSLTNQNMLAVLNGSAGWVAVPESGQPFHSADGKTWRRANTLPTTRHIRWQAAVAGGSKYVLHGTYTYLPVDHTVNANGSVTIIWPLWQHVTETFFVSSDGLNWTEQTNVTNAQGATQSLRGKLFHEDGKFWAQSYVDQSKLMQSSDGRTWQGSAIQFGLNSSSYLIGMFRFGGRSFIGADTLNTGFFGGTYFGFLNRADQFSGPWTTINQSAGLFEEGDTFVSCERPWGGRIWRMWPGNSIRFKSSLDGQIWEEAPYSKSYGPEMKFLDWIETPAVGAHVAVRADGTNGAMIISAGNSNPNWYPLSIDLGVPIRAIGARTGETAVAIGANGRFFHAGLPVVVPKISSGPASLTISKGATATLQVAAIGSAPLSYQWYQGSAGVTTTPVGSNSAVFTTPALNTQTSYWVRVSNPAGGVNSNTSTITVTVPVDIPDPALLAALRSALSKPTGDITETDLLTLTRLNLADKGITNLSGLEKATNLRILDIRRNGFADAAALWMILDSLRLYCLYVDVRRPGADPPGLVTQRLTDASGNTFFVTVDAPNLPTLDLTSLNVDTSSASNINALQTIRTAGVTVDTGGVNLPPYANATATVVNEFTRQVQLSAAGSSDVDGSIARHAWSWPGGSAEGTPAMVTLPYATTSVTLTVTDNQGSTSSATLQVTIERPYTNPAITNLTAAQIAGTRMVDIRYDVDAMTPMVRTSLRASSDGGETFSVPVATLSGDIGAGVAVGGGKAIVWDAGTDWPGRFSDTMRFEVTADDHVGTPADMALIPAGAFTMGRTSGDTDDDAPPVTVELGAFYIGKHEVTKELWDEVRTWAVANGYTDLAAGEGKAGNHPVHSVTWFDMVKWCNARSQKEGLIPCYGVGGALMKTGTTTPTVDWGANGYRLPTEAEWEKAARGAVNGKRYPWGTDTISHTEANYSSTAGSSFDIADVRGPHPAHATGSQPYTSPAGAFPANRHGLHDMAGNVWEWCWDWSGATYVDGDTDPRGASSGPGRIRRGGAWSSDSGECRIAGRSSHSPSASGNFIGFRLARTPVPEVIPPRINVQPVSMTTVDSGVTLAVSATGTRALNYQWYQGPAGITANPVGGNSPTYTTLPWTPTTSHWVRVSNAAGSVDSVAAVVDDFSPIPGGGFTMGRTSGDADSNAPPVSVTVSPFHIGKSEVSKALWDAVRTWAVVNGYPDLPVGEGKAGNHPVHSITWFDAAKWCNARSEMEGLNPCYTVGGAVMRTGANEPACNWTSNGYRLPTEAEWENAARGGASGKRFPWAADTVSHNQANFNHVGAEAYASGTTGYHPAYATGSSPYTSPVGSFAASGYGLLDMAGNASEWCWDWYGASTYVNGANDPRGAASGTGRLVRGGSWSHSALQCRAGHRANLSPMLANHTVGFRLARSSVPGAPIAPTISIQPGSTSITSGGRTTLAVSAGGAQPLTYQWYQGSVGLATTPVGANSSTFTTPVLNETRGYWVRVTNAAGSVNSAPATVTVIHPPAITAQPASTTISSGQTATLTVTAGGTAPLTYQWYEGNVGTTTTQVGANSPNFVTPALTATQSYWVRVSNAGGSVDSAPATVTIPVPPGITTQPASTTIILGQTATLAVEASGTPPMTFQWYQGPVGTTTNRVGTNSQEFTTPALTTTTDYWVRASNSVGSVDSALATVTVVTPPEITSQPASPTINAGRTATLTVTATSAVPLTYQWFQETAGTTATPVGTNSPSFTTPPLTATTTYRVRVSNPAGSVDSAPATVTVITPPAITSQPGSPTINSGQSATLTVTASGTDPLTYQWYQGDTGTTTSPVGTNSASFTTPALTSTTNYWVRVSNPAGDADSASTAVTVAIPPGITTQPASVTIASGQTATLWVTASGTTPFTYQWYQGATGNTTTPVGTNSASFTTPQLTVDTVYWVRVTNQAGSVDSASATVMMPVAPAITTQPASKTIGSGGTANLTVVANGTAPLTYQWYQGAVGVTTIPVGTNSPSFTTPALTATTTYWVRVSNQAGGVNSTLTTVTVIPPPTITGQPTSPIITHGQTAILAINATGAGPLTYQWYQGAVGNTTTPVGTNSATFTTPAIGMSKAYWVRVSNQGGGVDSAPAFVSVDYPMSMLPGFAFIPGGSFTMGRTSGDSDSNSPPVTVNVSPFELERDEVTKALWDEVRGWAVANGYTDLGAGAGKAPNHPVHTVSWTNAVKWCNARSEKDGLVPCYSVNGAVMRTGTSTPSVNWTANGYRLPTEAEWEKAARGWSVGRRFPSGMDTISHGDANFNNIGGETYALGATGSHPVFNDGIIPYTSPVGSLGPTGTGLTDMAGNVFEWCWDWYGASAYVHGATDPRGATSGTGRAFRGGSWRVSATRCRASSRNSGSPSFGADDFGFRVARSSVAPQIAPVVTTQPASTTIGTGDSTTLVANAAGSPPPTYQWYEGPVGVTTKPVGTNAYFFATPELSSSATYWVRVSNPAGSVDSAAVTVTVITPPSITSQPASVTVNSGGTTTLSVTATGAAPLTYEWYQGPVGTTTTPVGTNSPSFTSPALTATTSYWVRVSNPARSVASALATVTVITAPAITGQPASTTINSGQTATLTVTATGSTPLTYQWYQGALGTTTTPVGTSSASFITPALTATTTYWVRVGNPAGTMDSALATITVVPADVVLIPAGSFTMGRTSGDTDSDAPPVTVSVSAFYMGKNEVTKVLWDEVRTWAIANGYTDLAAGSGKAANHPVQTVTWWDAVKWCNARSQREGLTPCYTVSGAVMKTGTTIPTVNWSANGYRLPTEAEWEKAARGGASGKRFPWGTDTISHSQANYYATSSYSYDSSGAVNNYHPTYATGSQPYTSPVGSFAANSYGLHDMAGNVAEWCWDWYGASTYVNGAADPRGPASGERRVGRGGSWVSNAIGCKAGFRNSSLPYSGGSPLGFRIARSAVP